SRDVLAGARNLEVHIAKGIFSAQNVSQSNEPLFAINFTGDEPHGDTGDRSLQRNTRVVQRHGRSTYRTHRRRAIRAQSLRNLADGVWELLAGRNHWQQCAFGQCTVTNLATLRRTNATSLTRGVRREVVVVDVTLRLHWSQ